MEEDFLVPRFEEDNENLDCTKCQSTKEQRTKGTDENIEANTSNFRNEIYLLLVCSIGMIPQNRVPFITLAVDPTWRSLPSITLEKHICKSSSLEVFFACNDFIA